MTSAITRPDIHAAPRVTYRVTDYHGLADALHMVLSWHMIERLDLGARYWLLAGLSDELEAAERPADRKRADRIEAAVRTMAQRFCNEVDGWTLFCRDLNIDPNALLKDLPAFDTVAHMERSARLLANTPEEAAAYFRAKGKSELARMPTPEDVAESLREMLAWGERQWL